MDDQPGFSYVSKVDNSNRDILPSDHLTINKIDSKQNSSKKDCDEFDDELLNALEQQEFWDVIEVTSSQWICTTCYTQNDYNVSSTCTECSEPAVAEEQKIEKTKSCPVCTFDNLENETECSMCGTPLSMPKSSLDISSKESFHACGILGCTRKAEYFGFCSKNHYQLGLKKQMLPATQPHTALVLVGNSGDYSAHLLSRSHPKHKSVKEQFLQSWLKVDSVLGLPRVERIYQLGVKPEIAAVFDSAVRRWGNVRRRFHGTAQDPGCDFGVKQSSPPCASETCRVCSIVRNSFNKEHARKGSGGARWSGLLRYAPAIYFAPASSKSHDYNANSEKLRNASQNQQRHWRCMFLCKVVVGKPFTTTKGFLPHEECPPPGYTSIIGEKGSELNHDEIAIYDNTHCIPSYFIVYSLPYNGP